MTRKEDPSNLVSLDDGKHSFPKEFLKSSRPHSFASKKSTKRGSGKRKSLRGDEGSPEAAIPQIQGGAVVQRIIEN